MALLEVIRSVDRRQRWMLAVLAAISGLASAALIVMINKVAELVAQGQRPGLAAWLVFVGAFALYYAGKQYAMTRAVVIVEHRLGGLRRALVDKLRQTELLAADRIGRGRLYVLMATETNHLSLTCPLLVDAMQQVVLLTAALLYLLYVSPAAFGIFVLTFAAGLVSYNRINRRFRHTQRLVGRLQARVLDAIGDVIHGGKEVRLNAQRGDAVERAMQRLSRTLDRLQVEAAGQWSSIIILSSIVTYAALGMIGFVLPHLLDDYGSIIFQLVPIVLFSMGTLTKVVGQSPLFIRAETGLQALMAVDRELSEAPAASPEVARLEAQAFAGFDVISYAGIRFSHRTPDGQEGYTVGPLDLTLRKGEVVFLVGGNGSGKSTALHMLCGLYACDGGTIEVDAKAVEGDALAGFRELFSGVFAGFHLFDRLYGLEASEPKEVNRLIEELGLAGKVRFEQGRFSHLDLSTGQRKRLALIAALMEDRPIYLFDEWSAEQDVAFRRYFYECIVPRLKARGKLVIAATHDERYWGVADRVVKLDLGSIEWDRRGIEFTQR